MTVERWNWESDYEYDLRKMELRRCKQCHGGGRQNDAVPGDISFNSYTCDKCDGTGYVR
jgi:DnaJ-class molecular chaperone